MKELSDILNAYATLDATGVPCALATVMKVKGSAYRRPGARMLIASNGAVVGGVSGGCLERDVITRAGAVLSSKTPVLVRYDTSLDTENGSGYSLGCGGVIEILIEPLDTPAGKELMQWLLASQSGRCAMLTVCSKHHAAFKLADRLLLDESGRVHGPLSTKNAAADIVRAAQKALKEDQSDAFQIDFPSGIIDMVVQVLRPPTHLVIFGVGNDTLPLISFAHGLGWKVTGVDVRSASPSLHRTCEADAIIRCSIKDVSAHIQISSTSVVVVMTHNFSHDAQLIQWLSNRPLRYLGLLGPRHRTDLILGNVPAPTLHSPVGLDIGADNPQEVALAIVAEITAVLHHRKGSSLSQSAHSIHTQNPERSAPAQQSKTHADHQILDPTCLPAAS